MIRPLHLMFMPAVLILSWTQASYAQGGGAVTIECGSPALEETYCYTNNDSQTWVYTASGDGSLKIVFDRGTIESSSFDHLTIRDGVDASAPILFDHVGGQYNLGPPGSAINNTNANYHAVDVISSSGSLYMEMSSDGSVQCMTSTTYDEWEWRVFCIDCTPAAATFTVVQDCANFQYYVDVDISTLGSSEEITVTNTLDAPVVTVNTTGVTTVGPFTSGSEVQLTLEHESNDLCNLTSPLLVNPLCPTLVCGTTPVVETYCYGASENMVWAYGLPGDGQLRLTFDLGTMESSTFDHLRIYDGPDDQAPLLFDHTTSSVSDFGPVGSAINGPGTNYYAVDVLSSGPNLFMQLTSDGSVHCNGNSNYDPMEWRVTCEGCEVPGVDFLLEPDCEHLVYKASVNVTQLTGEMGLQITETTSGESVTATQVDTYNFSTFFGLDTTINFEITELDNAGCTYESGPLVYTRDSCVINSCGLDNYQLCYENSEDRWYTYRSMGDMPVAIYFYEGQVLGGDMVTVYNGLVDEPGNVIFSGNNGGNITGLTVNSANEDNALTLRIRSDENGSCTDGAATVPLRWDVGCGFVGMTEHASAAFTLFPNPTEGLLNIRLDQPSAGPWTIRVMDTSGRIAFEQRSASPASEAKFDLAALQNGQYFVQVITTEWTRTRGLQLIR